VATMVRARVRMDLTAVRTQAMATTLPRGRTHVAPQSQTATAAQVPVKRTTQGPGPLPRLCKGPMRMAAMGPRLLRRTAPLSTASIKRTRMEPPHRCTLRTAHRLMGRLGSTATAPRLVRPPTATSMPQQTAIPTRTPAVVGPTRMEVLILPRAMEVRIRAVHRPLVGAAAEGGGPGRKALEDRTAGAAVVAGADEGKQAVQLRTKSAL
jgi:hypothetical protein